MINITHNNRYINMDVLVNFDYEPIVAPRRLAAHIVVSSELADTRERLSQYQRRHYNMHPTSPRRGQR